MKLKLKLKLKGKTNRPAGKRIAWLAPLFVVGCAARPVLVGEPPAPAAVIELVESSPAETILDHADLRDAKDVWPQMIAGARASIDLAEFYAESAPASALEPVLQALEAALFRGVKVRLLLDNSMADLYAAVPARLAAHGAVVRRLDLRKRTGGIQHAKYFIIDGREAFLGSQNLDWRSLTHIHELGVRLRSAELSQALSALFEADWALADAEHPDLPMPAARPGGSLMVTAQKDGEPLRLELSYSPKGLLFQDSQWDLPRITQMLAAAKQSIRIELLVYSGPRPGDTDTPMAALEGALVAAAGRGVKVELLVSDWVRRQPQLRGLQGLIKTSGVTVKIVSIPPYSGGEIPYARVIHAKYLVVDGQRIWLGTSNWEDSYFLRCRNVSLLVDSAQLGARLDRFFADLWNSPYAQVASLPAS